MPQTVLLRSELSPALRVSPCWRVAVRMGLGASAARTPPHAEEHNQ